MVERQVMAPSYNNDTQCLHDPTLSTWKRHHANRTNSSSSNSSSSFIGILVQLNHVPFLVASLFVWPVGLSLLVLLLVMAKRFLTRRRLEKCHLPTVYWRPRFVNYQLSSSSSLSSERKLSSSNITNILPRMQRLNGPYGMYGTVYGLSTAVVHIAHPIPASAVLSMTTAASSSSSQQRQRRCRSSSRLVSTCGATKAPAYDHFKNFCGDGVFTADGTDWREKRAAVMHALLRPSSVNNTNGSSSRSSSTSCASFETKLQQELVTTARRLIDSIEAAAACRDDDSQQHAKYVDIKNNKIAAQLNIVPILQQATIGLIFRYITDSDPVDIFPTTATATRNTTTSSQRPNREENEERENDTLTATTTITPDAESLPTSSFSVQSSEQQQSLSDETIHGTRSSRPSLSSSSSSSLLSLLLKSYLQSIMDIRMIILAQSRSIWFLLPRWCYRTFSSMYQDEETTLVPIRRFAHLACQRALPGSPLATLQALPKYNNSSAKDHDDDVQQNHLQAQPPTRTFSKNLLDEATTLLFAGQDTSAATMSWTLHLLSLHPHVQDKVAAEVRSVLGNSDCCSGGHGGSDHHDDLGISKKVLSTKLPYLDAIVKEAMRLYPVAPFVVRKLPFDVPVVPSSSSNDNGNEDHCAKPTVTLPAGSFACIWIYSLHRNPEFWRNPNTFWPERWLLSPQQSPNQENDHVDNKDDDIDKGITNGSFMPFAMGPRNCVGQPLAFMILRTLLARLLQRFEFRDARCNDSTSSNTNTGLGDKPATTSSSWSVDNPEAYLKDMQAGFTVLPRDGVKLAIYRRGT